MRIDLDAIPRREPGMEPFEVMISESQERMLAIVRPDRWDDGRARSASAGACRSRSSATVTDDGDIAIVDGGRGARPDPGGRAHERRDRPRAARRAAAAPPRRPGAGRPGRRRPDGLPGARHGPGRRPPGAARLGRTCRRRRPVFEQYDSTVQANTVAGPGHGAAVLRIKGTTKALVATTDAQPGRRARSIRGSGAALSVAEATRNVSITGARPLGVTNCLNFGDPTRPEAFWQLTEAVRGLGDACRALGLPVTGGNVSLYNESPAGAIAPTPEIGVVGLLEDVDRLGSARRSGPTATRSSSSARRRRVSRAASTPRLAGVAAEDGPPSARPRRWRRRSRRSSARRPSAASLASAQDVAGGGLAVALAEVRDLGRRRSRARRPPPARRSRTRRPSTCSARARRGSSSRLPAAPRRRRSCSSPASTACRRGARGRSAATGSSSSSPGPARRAPRRSAAAASPTRSTSPSPTSATPGRPACRGPSAGTAR